MANTLADLKAAVADDLSRTDITAQIAAAITAAIDFYQDQSLYFTETRASTFVTVAGQSRYTSADDADIPLYLDFEEAFIVDSSSEIPLDPTAPALMEYLLGNGAPSGRPTRFAYYEQSVWLYPTPGTVYTFRPLATVKVAAPAADGTTGNAWMQPSPYELIRCRAKAFLALHTVNDTDLLVKMVGLDGNGGACKVALDRLRRETTKKASGGGIRPSAF